MKHLFVALPGLYNLRYRDGKVFSTWSEQARVQVLGGTRQSSIRFKNGVQICSLTQFRHLEVHNVLLFNQWQQNQYTYPHVQILHSNMH